MDVRLPDGRILKNVPEGTTKAQIAAKLGISFDEPKAAPTRDPVQEVIDTEIPSAGEAALIGLGSGLTRAGQGAKQLALDTFGSEKAAKDYTNKVQQEQALFNRTPVGSSSLGKIAQTTGEILPAFALPGGAFKTLPRAAATATGLGATEFVDENESRLGNMARALAGGTFGYGASKLASSIPSAIQATKHSLGKLVPKGVPEALYEKAVKLPPSIATPDRNKLISTALREGISPTEKGLLKANSIISGLNSQIDDIINNATSAGVKIPKTRLYKELSAVRKEIGGAKFNAPKDLRRLNKIVGEFDRHLKSLKKDTLTPRELQEFKKDLYQRINFNAKQGSAQYLNQKVEKALARGARGAVEEIDPLVAALNRRQGDLIALRDKLPQSVNRIENRDLIGLGTATKTAAGTLLGGPTGGALTLGLSSTGHPLVRANLALALSKLQNTPKPIPKEITPYLPEVLRRLGAQAGRIEEAPPQKTPLLRRQ